MFDHSTHTTFSRALTTMIIGAGLNGSFHNIMEFVTAIDIPDNHENIDVVLGWKLDDAVNLPTETDEQVTFRAIVIDSIRLARVAVERQKKLVEDRLVELLSKRTDDVVWCQQQPQLGIELAQRFPRIYMVCMLTEVELVSGGLVDAVQAVGVTESLARVGLSLGMEIPTHIMGRLFQ